LIKSSSFTGKLSTWIVAIVPRQFLVSTGPRLARAFPTSVGSPQHLLRKRSALARVVFTQNIQRHVPCPETRADGATVRDVLEHVFADNPRARSYVLDDQGALRRHMNIFVDGRVITDRRGLSDAVAPDGSIYVFQALSGG
jgi:hypothetical protein